MAPTIRAGDFLLVRKNPGRSADRTLAHGAVVAFRPPHDPASIHIMRVAGLPGDTLSMTAKRLRINGRAVDEPYTLHADEQDVRVPAMLWMLEHAHASGVEVSNEPSRDTWGPADTAMDVSAWSGAGDQR
jgi:signal peptidase I